MSALFKQAQAGPKFGLQAAEETVNVVRVDTKTDALVRRYARSKGYTFQVSVTDGTTRYQMFTKKDQSDVRNQSNNGRHRTKKPPVDNVEQSLAHAED